MNKYFLYFFTIRFGKRVPPSSDVTRSRMMGRKTDENSKFCFKIKTPIWQPNKKGTKQAETGKFKTIEDFAHQKAMEDFSTALSLHHKYVTQSAHINAKENPQ